jgi:hypothetical protein
LKNYPRFPAEDPAPARGGPSAPCAVPRKQPRGDLFFFALRGELFPVSLGIRLFIDAGGFAGLRSFRIASIIYIWYG